MESRLLSLWEKTPCWAKWFHLVPVHWPFGMVSLWHKVTARGSYRFLFFSWFFLRKLSILWKKLSLCKHQASSVCLLACLIFWDWQPHNWGHKAAMTAAMWGSGHGPLTSVCKLRKWFGVSSRQRWFVSPGNKVDFYADHLAIWLRFIGTAAANLIAVLLHGQIVFIGQLVQRLPVKTVSMGTEDVAWVDVVLLFPTCHHWKYACLFLSLYFSFREM